MKHELIAGGGDMAKSVIGERSRRSGGNVSTVALSGINKARGHKRGARGDGKYY